jgi:hypothetical protein
MAITAGVGKGVEPYADVLFSRIASIGSSGVSMTMKPCVYHPTLGSALYDTWLRPVIPNAGMRPVEHQLQTPVDRTFDSISNRMTCVSTCREVDCCCSRCRGPSARYPRLSVGKP